MNNERIRRSIRRDMGACVAFGATWSEAANRELNGRFGRIMHLHAPTMRLKLRIFRISKLIAFFLRDTARRQFRKGGQSPSDANSSIGRYATIGRIGARSKPLVHAKKECADGDSGYARIADGRAVARERGYRDTGNLKKKRTPLRRNKRPLSVYE